jgi:hypothetical protein
MTAVLTPKPEPEPEPDPEPSRARPGHHQVALTTSRLLWLEFRHNAMAWTIPIALALFWLTTLRKVMAQPPLWYLRAATVQTGVVLDFVIPVTGAAAWMGTREHRRRTADILATVPVPRSRRLLLVWIATTGWALIGYLICVGIAYGAIAAQASFGGPLWWPAAVGAASVPAFAAIGLGAATLLPSRFTAPAVAVGTFFVFALSTELITGSQSVWQVSPLVSAPWDTGPNVGAATFYPYVPDLGIAQLMFLVGLTVTILAAIATIRQPGSRRSRALAAGIAAVGLLTTGSAVALTGTGRLGPTGMIVIPGLHDAANDRPLPVRLVCSHDPVPVCVNPAFTRYLPQLSAHLRPLLTELAGLPGAPVKVSQTTARYQQGPGNEVIVTQAEPQLSGRPPVFRFLMPDQLNGPPESSSQVASLVAGTVAPALTDYLAAAGPQATKAQQAVALALLLAAKAHPPAGGRGLPPVLAPSSPGYAAAARFAALPPMVRHKWLVSHLAALRAGHVTLAQLP